MDIPCMKCGSVITVQNTGKFIRPAPEDISSITMLSRCVEERCLCENCFDRYNEKREKGRPFMREFLGPLVKKIHK